MDTQEKINGYLDDLKNEFEENLNVLFSCGPKSPIEKLLLCQLLCCLETGGGISINYKAN